MNYYEKFGESPEMRKNLIFSSVFILENMLHSVVDRNSEISSKQWLVLTCAKIFPTPPDLTMFGNALGCSRQNIKKLALQLEKDGYIRLVKSETDARRTCIEITEKGKAFNEKNTQISEMVHEQLFSEFTPEDIEKYYELSVKMMHGIRRLDQYFEEVNHEK